MPDKLNMHTKNATQENIERIGALFPNCIVEAADEGGGLDALLISKV